ncbi:adenylate/guanylate cyclase domain-containing protein [Piscinibacter sakaiensis]|uniref:adenylate/guanylate cyclase domain-containing protein n=1 Tax=Piscinibacter sakaiensis TaxID=1547922 RepID=UPI003AB096FC
MADLSSLTMTQIIRMQNQLQEELTRRFARQMLLVFSDIVGSTPYFAKFGDAAGRQLQQLHLDLLGGCVAECDGRIVDTAGDGAFCVFPNAEAAVKALIEFHQRIAHSNAGRGRQHQLQVRVGMHWGSVLSDGVAVSGDAVNLCARVAASADPGEIRLTREVFLEIERSHRLMCHALGTVQLKGVATAVELLTLDWRDQALFPRRLRIEETREELTLPQQDIVAFGRLAEHDGLRANDVVLSHPDADSARQISRWHFEFRRLADGLQLRALSDNGTEVDGVAVGKGEQVPVRAGSRIRIAGVLTLELIGPQQQAEIDDADSTMMFRGARSAAAPPG